MFVYCRRIWAIAHDPFPLPARKGPAGRSIMFDIHIVVVVGRGGNPWGYWASF